MLNINYNEDISIKANQCKNYNNKLQVIQELVNVLYNLNGGVTCGSLCHSLIDEGNCVSDEDIKVTLGWIEQNPDKIDYEISKLICELLLKIPIESRRLYKYSEVWADDLEFNKCTRKCCQCIITTGEDDL